ncbi:DUF2231 domain-containing protein [Maribacter antarcticus]|uniref:DUF2231 domain-containing protein n=1 Tax=Maribacter antarcticus TaxID=505250 RepID=UPI000AD73632
MGISIYRQTALLVHFPIGILVVALFKEVLTLNGKRPGLREGIHLMIYLGAILAILSALLGWLLRMHNISYNSESMRINICCHEPLIQ